MLDEQPQHGAVATSTVRAWPCLARKASRKATTTSQPVIMSRRHRDLQQQIEPPGAFDFVTKPINFVRVSRQTITKTIRPYRILSEAQHSQLAESARTRRCHTLSPNLAERLALDGETGSAIATLPQHHRLHDTRWLDPISEPLLNDYLARMARGPVPPMTARPQRSSGTRSTCCCGAPGGQPDCDTGPCHVLARSRRHVFRAPGLEQARVGGDADPRSSGDGPQHYTAYGDTINVSSSISMD